MAHVTPASTVDSTAGFGTFDLSPPLLRATAAAGFSTPRPIQAETLPPALAGRDVLGLAPTGTGKTAAFALPLLERLLERPGRGPRVLVVAPTRELALQIHDDFRRLARYTRLRAICIYGGVSDRPQIRELRSHPDVIIACPGRLLDLYGQGLVDFGRLEALVLDEADHMFDMGFLPDIRRIIAALPAQRQNLLFAATMPPELRSLADRILRNPVVVELAHSRPATTIEHALYPVQETRKIDLLHHFLGADDFVSAIVFTRTKHRARRLAVKLDRKGHRAVALQGNMSQGQRDRAMQGFRRRDFDVLVATDIVARGIDVEQVSHVINFDVPNTPEAYTHRIGRTGRSERTGKACTFVTVDDAVVVRAIERTIGAEIPLCTVEGFEPVGFVRMPVSQHRRGGRGRGVPGSQGGGQRRGRSGGPGDRVGAEIRRSRDESAGGRRPRGRRRRSRRRTCWGCGGGGRRPRPTVVYAGTAPAVRRLSDNSPEGGPLTGPSFSRGRAVAQGP